MSRSSYRNVNGILLLDKPLGLSSNQALQAARRLFRAAKGGHTGSLDPLATGLLPICFGEATKIAGLLLGSRKAYDAECLLGVTTRTDDGEGEETARRPVPPELDDDAIRAALAALTGRIVQVPPAYSAIKRGGVPMYVRARRGEDVQVPSREVDIHALGLAGRAGDRLRLHVECGSGTYIRSLVRDLGERLGCGAHLTALRRLWVEPFASPAMHALDTLQALAAEAPERLDSLLLPVDAGLALLPVVRVDAAASDALRQGRGVVLNGMAPGRYRAYAADGRLLALAEYRGDGRLHVVRGFNLPPAAAAP